jgi:DNA-directed RNA polymerase subunit RPC12/RpoP
MSEGNPILDVEKQSIRGRACPQCGGKIIPSNRALYQSTGNPDDVFPLWECERCGYEKMSEKKPALKPAPGGAHKKLER